GGDGRADQSASHIGAGPPRRGPPSTVLARLADDRGDKIPRPMASTSHDRQADAALLAASRSTHRRPARQRAPETYEEKLAQLNELREAALHSAPEAEEKQHARGKYTARERIEKLLDPGSFQELDTFVRHRTYEFDMQKNRPWGDAVVTGHGSIDGRTVCVFSQDFTL